MTSRTITHLCFSEKPCQSNNGFLFLNKVVKIDSNLKLMVELIKILPLIKTKYFFLTINESNFKINFDGNNVRPASSLLYGDVYFKEEDKILFNNRWNRHLYLGDKLKVICPIMKTSDVNKVISYLPLTEYDFLFALYYFLAECFSASYSSKLLSNSDVEIKRKLFTSTDSFLSTRDWILSCETKIKDQVLNS